MSEFKKQAQDLVEANTGPSVQGWTEHNVARAQVYALLHLADVVEQGLKTLARVGVGDVREVR